MKNQTSKFESSPILIDTREPDPNPWESIIALHQRYRIPFLFAGSSETAARLGESILLRWWKEHVKALEEIRIATKKAVRNTPGRIFEEGYPLDAGYP